MKKGETFTKKQMAAIKEVQSRITDRLQKRAAKRTQGCQFQQGVYDALMHELPFVISTLMMETAVEIKEVARQVASLIEKDSRRAELVREAVAEGKRRAMEAKPEEPAE